MSKDSVVIIGGGISGLAAAHALSARGFQVVLLERGACCKATSNNSLRIIHGGFRYLQTLDFKRLITSLGDQTAILGSFPDLVTALPCYMALSGRGLKSRWPIEAACRFYSLFMKASRSPLPRPRFANSRDVSSLVPSLYGTTQNGVLVWYDGLLMNPAELGIRLMQLANESGAKILEQRAVVGVKKQSRGSYEVATENGETFRGEVVINTAGPWVRKIELPFEPNLPQVGWCKGFNVVVRSQLDSTNAIGFESKEGRLFFVVPRGEGSAIGTWYLPIDEILSTPSVNEQEISVFLEAFNVACPQLRCSMQDVIDIDVGYLPMKRVGNKGPELFGSEIVTAHQGYIEVLSTKYTTFRSQAAHIVSMVDAYLKGSRT